VSKEEDLWAVCLHESAHACAGRALHLDCGGASIGMNGAGRATVHKRFCAGCAGSHATLLFAALVVSLSGAIGERLLLGVEDVPDHDDRKRQAALLRLLDRPDDALALAQREAVALVHGHAPRILRVAEALRRAGSLSGPEIDALIAQPTRPDPEPDRAAVREGMSPLAASLESLPVATAARPGGIRPGSPRPHATRPGSATSHR